MVESKKSANITFVDMIQTRGAHAFQRLHDALTKYGPKHLAEMTRSAL
jgi:hypothetical protein